MPQAELGSYKDTAGIPRPVQAVAIVNPNGDEVELNEDGYTPYQVAVLALLTQIAENTTPAP